MLHSTAMDISGGRNLSAQHGSDRAAATAEQLTRSAAGPAELARGTGVLLECLSWEEEVPAAPGSDEHSAGGGIGSVSGFCVGWSPRPAQFFSARDLGGKMVGTVQRSPIFLCLSRGKV